MVIITRLYNKHIVNIEFLWLLLLDISYFLQFIDFQESNLYYIMTHYIMTHLSCCNQVKYIKKIEYKMDLLS